MYIIFMQSNFSAMSDTAVGDPLIRPKSYTSTQAPPVPPRPRGKCVALGKDGHLNLHSIEDTSNHRNEARNSSKFKKGHVQNIAEKPIISTIYANKVFPKDQSPTSLKWGNKKQADGHQERETEEDKDEKEEKKHKKFPSPKPTLNRCFFCQHPRPTSVSLDRCVSDSYLHCKVLQLSHFTPADRTTPTKPSAIREQEDGKISTSRITTSINIDGVTAPQEPQFLLGDGAPSLQNDINFDWLKKMSNDFLPSPLYNSTIDEDRIEESSGDVMVSEHSDWLEEAGQIERQVAYFNLATEDSGTTGLSSPTTPTTIAKKCGLSITSSEIDTAFDSEDFVTDLMQKLAQLADSSEDQSSHLLQFRSRPFEPIQTLPTDKQPNSDTPDPISRGEKPEAICCNTSPELCTSDSEQNKSEFNPASSSSSSPRMSASLPSSDQATKEAHETSSTPQVHKAASQSKCVVETSVAIKPDEDYSPIAATSTVTGTDEPHPSTNSNESFICVNSSITTSSSSSNNNNNNQCQPPKTSPSSPENSVVLISTNSPPPTTGSTPTNGTSTASESNQSSVKVSRMVASGSSCSQWRVTQEAQRQLSRVLALISPPLVGSRSQGDGDGEATRDGGEDTRSKIATLTCLIATWEPSSDT